MAHFSAKPVKTVFHLLIRFGRPGSVAECWCSDRDSSITRPVLLGSGPAWTHWSVVGEPHTALHQQRYSNLFESFPMLLQNTMDWWHVKNVSLKYVNTNPSKYFIGYRLLHGIDSINIQKYMTRIQQILLNKIWNIYKRTIFIHYRQRIQVIHRTFCIFDWWNYICIMIPRIPIKKFFLKQSISHIIIISFTCGRIWKYIFLLI